MTTPTATPPGYLAWPNGTNFSDLNDGNGTNKNCCSENYDYACFSIFHYEGNTGVLVSHQVVLWSAVLFVGVGLIGNTLSMLVFSSPSMRNQSSNIYLLILSVSDSSYLVSVFLSKTLTELRCLYFTDSEIDIMHRSTPACITLQYLMDLFSDFSTLLILAFTIERFIAVYLPLRFKNICTVRRAKLVCLSTFVASAALIAPYHSMYMGRYMDYDVCTVLPEYERLFSIFYIVEASVFRIVPVVIIAVLNVFIIVRVTKMAKKSKERKANTMKVLNKNVNQQHGEQCQLLNNKNGEAPAARKQEEKKKKESKKELDKSMQLTIMLILVSTCYIVLYLPVLIHFILWKLVREQVMTMSEIWLTTMENYTRALYISGYGINFFLYTMSGKTFRDQLRSLAPCDVTSSSPAAGGNHTRTTAA